MYLFKTYTQARICEPATLGGDLGHVRALVVHHSDLSVVYAISFFTSPKTSKPRNPENENVEEEEEGDSLPTLDSLKAGKMQSVYL